MSASRTVASRGSAPVGHDPAARKLVPEPLSWRRAEDHPGWMFFVSSETVVRALLLDDFGLVFPSRARLDAAERWFLRRREVSEVSTVCEVVAYEPES